MNNMNELIKVNYDSGKPTVSGRKLHEALGIKTQYTKWFERMCEYGFNENTDYILVSQICQTNNPKNPTTTITDHLMTLDMAKEICMIQRSWLHEQGIQYKQGDIWLLYQKYAEQGYTNTKTQTFNGTDGEIHTKVHTYWTQKSRLFIYGQLKAVGILPLIEQGDNEEETA